MSTNTMATLLGTILLVAVGTENETGVRLVLVQSGS